LRESFSERLEKVSSYCYTHILGECPSSATGTVSRNVPKGTIVGYVTDIVIKANTPYIPPSHHSDNWKYHRLIRDIKKGW
jgi:hypothetical protein